MMHKWTPEIISFMKDASEYSDYFDCLAEFIFSITGKKENVCDAGCGIGQLAVSMSKYYPKVTGIDINPDALAVLSARIKSENLHNVFSLNEDLFTYKNPEVFDLMVFNYFGDIRQILEIRDRFNAKTIIVIKRNYPNHRFSFSEQKIQNYNRQSTVDYLGKNRIIYKEYSFSHEFGQPFRSINDALRFFNIYSKDEDRSLINEQNVRLRLTQTEDSEFPYYLKQIKDNRVFVI